jgi:protein-tyrosine phosphatase
MVKSCNSRDLKNCIDIHSHILPGIDDGSSDMEESLAMLNEARINGIKTIVATPHVRTSKFDFSFARKQYEKLREKAEQIGIDIMLGYEVNCEALIEFDFKNLDILSFLGSDSFLLEFHDFSLPPNWKLIIKKIQQAGKKVIIAHPERYSFIQNNIEIAKEMVRIGCQLQCDAFPFDLGRFEKQRKTAVKMLDNGLVSWIATDAHMPEHYNGYREIMEDFGSDLLDESINFGGITNGLV